MGREFKRSMSQKLRMDGRDYSRPGWYFLTLGADYHRHLFGRIERGVMMPNALGLLVERCWSEIPLHYDSVEMGAWQVMPNHFHGLIRITRSGGKGLGEMLNVFKGAVTRAARRNGLLEVSRNCGKEQGHGEKEPVRVWSPNYYDVICFNSDELAVRENYVRANPRRWSLRSVPQGEFDEGLFRGNRSLLERSLPRRGLRVSRRASDVEISQLRDVLSGFDGVVFSTFFSPGERVVLSALRSGSARMVWVLPMAMPRSISADWTDSFLEGRTLWLSSFPEELTKATHVSCEEANLQVDRFCLADGERRLRNGE